MNPNPYLKKLGYDNNDRLVIIHTDDIGMCQASVQAFRDLWSVGGVTSGAVMVPCPWFPATAQMCRENPDMDMGQRSKFLGIIVKESERLTRLINQVLDMAKIDSGRIEWHIENLDLRALILDAINSTSQLFRDKAATLREELGDQPVMIAGDHDRLTQVIINLLSNAVKFCPDQTGDVVIRLVPATSGWRIEVRDNGPGIAHDQHKLIFEKFHQVSDSHAGKPKGTGLGLPISQKIVEHHNGRIWVESEIGQGTTFIVELPGKA